jgi:type IV secretory pathway VirD2 relaxase
VRRAEQLRHEPGPAQWIIVPEAERTLRDLGVRGDIIKTMHRAMAGQGSALRRPTRATRSR